VDSVSQKLFNRRSTLDVRKFVFANRVVDNWNYLSEACIKSVMLNGFKNIHRYISLSLTEPETSCNQLLRRVSYIWRKPVSTNAISALASMASVNLVKQLPALQSAQTLSNLNQLSEFFHC